MGNYSNEKLKNYNVEPGKAYYIDVNKNLSFSLFGKLWWPVVAKIEYLGELNRTNDIILPLNTTIKNLRQLCNLEFMDQDRRVRYWDAKSQIYKEYPVTCGNASEGMPVEAGKPYRVEANHSWKGEICLLYTSPSPRD